MIQTAKFVPDVSERGHVRQIEGVGLITPQRPGIDRRQYQQYGREGGADQRCRSFCPRFGYSLQWIWVNAQAIPETLRPFVILVF